MFAVVWYLLLSMIALARFVLPMILDFLALQKGKAHALKMVRCGGLDIDSQ